MRAMALAGVGLLYTLEDRLKDNLKSNQLRIVLEAYAPEVPGLYLYFPSRSQVSPALKALVEVAREVAKERA
jgi:DNA-binding transcriptional LysR family regulator